MATTERYTTVIELNSEQAKRTLDELKRKVESWKSDLAEAREKKMGKSFINAIKKELTAAEKELKKYDNEVMRTIDTLNNIGKASVEQIEDAQKSLLRLSKEVPQDSAFYQQLNGMLGQVTQELENIKATTAFEKLQGEAAGTARTFEHLKAEAEFVRQTVENIDTASLKQLRLAEQTAKNIKESTQQGSVEYNTASSNIEKIRAKLTEVENEERKVVSLVDRYNQELKGTYKQMDMVADETELIDRTLAKLSSASVRDIEYSIKILNEQLRDTERTGGNVEQLTGKLKQLNEELRKVQDMQKPDTKKGNILSRGVNFLNTNWGAITQVLGAYSGIRDVVKGSVEAFAEMDQEMNNVRKYTGQSIEEVERMNEVFKQLDTRTPREQLNQLAGSAGRLGITSTSAVLEFVDAADKIGVALGDDLGQGAVDKIGKLAMAFGEDETRGLRGAMLATGSAVNELAQNSAAQADYLVDFAARLSGVGVQAGLTQSQILGLGAAMDENMQRDEMAATAISQIITKMTTDSATFARIAGKNVEEFANLVKTDMNAALMQFFESMNKKGGFTELAPLFEQMGLDGTRAIGVLSTLASKIDDVRKHQELATEAYEKGTSVIDEYNIQNETYQAKLEKCRKKFNELRIELGKKLLPVATMCISTTGLLVKTLETVSGFVIENHKLIITLTAAIAGYSAAVAWANIQSKLWVAIEAAKNVAMKAGAAVTATYKGTVLLLSAGYNTLTGNTKRATAAMRLFNTVTKASPWGLAIAGISAVATALFLYTRRTEEATEAQKAFVREKSVMDDVDKRVAESTSDEITRLKLLRKTLEDNTAEYDARKRALDEIKGMVPTYHASLSEEGRLINNNTRALDDYVTNLKKAARAQAAFDKMAKLQGEDMQQEDAKTEAERNMRTAESLLKGYGASPGSRILNNNLYDENNKLVRRVTDQEKKSIWDYQKWYNVEKEKAAAADKALLQNKATEDKLEAIVKQGAPKMTASDANGNDTLAYWQGQLDEWNKKLSDLRGNASATASEIEAAQKKVKEAQDKVDLFTNRKNLTKQEKKEEDERKKRLKKADDAAKAETEQRLAALTHQYAMGQVAYRDYVKQQEQIQLEGISRRMLIYGEETLEYQKLAHKRQELLLNGDEQGNRLRMSDVESAHRWLTMELEEQAERELWTEEHKNEALFRENMRYLEEKLSVTRKKSEEHMQLQQEMDEMEQRERMRRQQYYQQQLEQVREQYLGLANDRVKDMALKNLDDLHAQGLLKEQEYQEALLAIKAQYANYETNSEHDQRVGANALKVAQNSAKQKLDNQNSTSASIPIVGDIMLYQSTMEQLKQMYQSDEITYAEYMAAKKQLSGDFCNDLAQKMQAAYNAVNQVLSAASNYFSAQQEYETAQVQKKYEKQIEAAGNNQKKVKKIQEKQQKEEAAIKSKYAKRAAAIQMAQAVAQTAISAINAYSSAAAIPVTGHILAPIAAAAAIAAGMLQIATIKKQQQAQEAGYYEGGFTGGKRYRREAGVVHEGEFVANHQAVENPNIVPFLNFLDQAQRNNTVGSLTMQDVTRSMGGGGTSQVITPIVNVQTDNEELREAVVAHREATEQLLARLEYPIDAQVVLTGPDGLNEQQKRLNKMMRNK
jgi:TP901 family phage tail tape measure protein